MIGWQRRAWGNLSQVRFISKIQTDGKQFDSGLDVRQGGSDKVKHGQTR